MEPPAIVPPTVAFQPEVLITYNQSYFQERSHTMATRVGAKGQIVIEKEVRDELGIEPGWEALQLVVDGHLEVHFIPPRHNRSLAGILAPYTDVRIPDEDAFHEATEWARGAEAEERERLREASCE